MSEEAEEQSDGVSDEEQEAGINDDEGAAAVSGSAEGDVDEAVEAAGETDGRKGELYAAAPMGPTGVGPGSGHNGESQIIARSTSQFCTTYHPKVVRALQLHAL